MTSMKAHALAALLLAVLGLAGGQVTSIETLGPVTVQQPAVDPDAVVCLPTCSTTDSRYLAVVGDDPTTFGLTDVVLSVNASLDSNWLHIGIYDGDTTLNSDKSVFSTPPPALKVELWADPARSGPGGAGAVPLKTWQPAGANVLPFANQSWTDIFESHALIDPHEHARTASAYRYSVRISAIDPLVNRGWNAFKIRTLGTLGASTDTLAFLAPYTHSLERAIVYPNFVSFANPGPSTYDGTWTFGFSVPTGVRAFDMWDGDFDFGNCRGVEDDDDPNTPNVVPWFADPATARAEGVGRVEPSDGNAQPCPLDSGFPSAGLLPTGSPMDDNQSAVFERFPQPMGAAGVMYRVIDPLGQTWNKFNPSGQREWERLTVVAAPGESLVPGVYQVEAFGVDLSNLNFWKFAYRVLGNPREGPPACEDCFHRKRR